MSFLLLELWYSSCMLPKRQTITHHHNDSLACMLDLNTKIFPFFKCEISPICDISEVFCINSWFPCIPLLGPVLRGGGDSRLHLPRNPPGYGGWEGQVRAWVRLVVPGRLHVWNAVRRDSLLCRVPGGNLREDHEPQGELLEFEVDSRLALCQSHGNTLLRNSAT